MSCGPFDPVGCAVNAAVGGALESIGNGVIEGLGKVLAGLGTFWVGVSTPDLTAGGSASQSDASAFSSEITLVLNYVMWISLALSALSIVMLAGRMTMNVRRGDGMMQVGKLGYVIGGVIIISGASGLISLVLPRGPVGAGGTVAFLQSSLWWIMLAVAVGGAMVGAARMAITMRAEPAKELLIALIRLVVITGASVTLVSLLITAADNFSSWIIDASTNCNGGAVDACFGASIQQVLVLSSGSGLGMILVILLGIIAIFASLVQMVLMLARSGMLVILTGILPLSAAAGMSGDAGKQWLNKNIAWLVAFLLYKPAAAIVYAAAFQLVGTPWFTQLAAGSADGLIAVTTGLMMMVMALVALPALMRFVTPMVGSMTGGGGGGGMMAAAGMASMPSGAAAVSRMSTSNGGSAPIGATGSAGTSGSAGSAGATASAGSAASSGGSAGAGSAAAGAAAGGSAAGAGAASGAAAGAAGGPVGAAAGAALGAAQQVGQAAQGAVETTTDQSTGGQ